MADLRMRSLVRVAFVNICSTRTGVFILASNHASHDNLSMDLLLEDLNSALDHGLTREDMLRAPGHHIRILLTHTACIEETTRLRR